MGCGKHYSNARFISQGEVAIGRSLLQGRCQERVAIGGSWHQGEVAIGRSLLQGRCQEREVAIGGSWHQGEVAIGRSLLQGRCQERESPLGEVGIYGESRDREIAPTGEVSGESRHWGKLAFMERSRSGDRSYRKLDRKTYIKVEYIKEKPARVARATIQESQESIEKTPEVSRQ